MILTPEINTGWKGPNQKLGKIVFIAKKEVASTLIDSEVTLKQKDDGEENGDTTRRYTIINKEGLDIGFVDVGLNEEQTQMTIGDIKIQDDKLNKGYGKATYKELVRTNKLPLVSYISSPEADRVRESLQREGIATIDEDGIRILNPENILCKK